MRFWRASSILIIAFISTYSWLTLPNSVSAQESPPPIPSTPQEQCASPSLGPAPEDFPESYNPLTGLPVKDPALLKLPAVLVSVSNFPGATRPQSGISFADQLYEFWIGVGMTRFLPVFHGSYPEIRPALVGDCAPRWDIFEAQEGTSSVGNFIWYDENRNGVQDVSERGVPGVCVSLVDAQSGEILSNSTSDSNGYYGFNVSPGKAVYVALKLPPGTAISALGNSPISDHDVVEENGIKTATLHPNGNDFSLDVGIIWESEIPTIPSVGKGGLIKRSVWVDSNRNGIQDEGEKPIPGIQVNLYAAETDELLAITRTDENGVFQFEVDPATQYYLNVLPDLGAYFTQPDEEEIPENAVNAYEDPLIGTSPPFTAATFNGLTWTVGVKEPQAGPLRSGRIVFQYITDYFNSGRLFYASKHESVHIGGAGNVYGEDPNDISSAFLNTSRMLDAAASANPAADLHYASNVFNATPPAGGQPAHTLTYFVNVLNTSQWRYDVLSEKYLRFDDHSDGRGKLYPSTDRMTGRQLHFDNLILVFAEHKQIQGLKIDMSIKINNKNKAMLFRNGKVYPVFWSSINEEYEKTTQRLRPPRIIDENGQLVPLKPGTTWYIMVTTRTTLQEQSPGLWKARFFEPPLVGNFIK